MLLFYSKRWRESCSLFRKKIRKEIFCFKMPSSNIQHTHMTEVASLDPENPSNIINTNVKLSSKGEGDEKTIKFH